MSAKKRKFHQSMSPYDGKQSKSIKVEHLKKEVQKKMKTNQPPRPTSQTPKDKLQKLTPKSKLSKLNLNKNTSPWKLKGVLFFASVLMVILLIPALIVAPSATGSELDSAS